MSRDVSVFFSGPATTQEARELLALRLQIQFEGDGTIDDPFHADHAGFNFVLIVDHELEPDMGIPFDAYRFQLSILPNAQSRPTGHETQSMLGLYFRDVLRSVGLDAIAVEDLQRVLEYGTDEHN